MAMSERSRPDRNWQPWKLDELHAPRKRQGRSSESDPAAAARPPQDDRKTLERLRAEAIAEARKEGYQAGHEEGRERGYAEGLAAGRADGRREGLEAAEAEAEKALQARLRKEVARIKPLLAGFDTALNSIQQEMADKLTRFALDMASEVAVAARDARPEAILDIVRDLLHLEPTLAERPRLWLHPEDLELVREQLSDELEAAGWILQPDDQLDRGGCRATSATGEFDATWETRMQQLRSAILEILKPADEGRSR